MSHLGLTRRCLIPLYSLSFLGRSCLVLLGTYDRSCCILLESSSHLACSCLSESPISFVNHQSSCLTSKLHLDAASLTFRIILCIPPLIPSFLYLSRQSRQILSFLNFEFQTPEPPSVLYCSKDSSISFHSFNHETL